MSRICGLFIPLRKIVQSTFAQNAHKLVRYEDGVSELTMKLVTILPNEQGQEIMTQALSLSKTTEDMSVKQLGFLSYIINEVKDTCSA